MISTSALCLFCFVAVASTSSLYSIDEKSFIDLFERFAGRKTYHNSLFEHETMRNQSERSLMTLRQNCDAVGSFSGLEYALMGYNAFYGYPLAKGRDPGFGIPIFLSTYVPQKYTMDCKYMIPNGFIDYPDVACETSFESQEVRGQSDFESHLGVSVNIEGGGWGASFSASTEYKNTVNEMRNAQSIYIFSSANCKYFSLLLDERSPPSFEPNFLAEVQHLLTADQTNEQEKYYNFFATYGTHYVKYMTFGARLTHQHKMTQTQYNTAQESSLSVSVQASYEGLFSVGGGANVDEATRSAVEKFQQNVETTTITVGAQPSTGDITEWASAVKNTPMPMKYTLGSIEEIFTTAFFQDGMLSDYDLERVRTNINNYKDPYFASLLAKGEAIIMSASDNYQVFDVILNVAKYLEEGRSNDPVSIKLMGTNNECPRDIILNKGGESTLTFGCRNLGDVSGVRLSKSGDDGVFVNSVIVTEKVSQNSYLISFGTWLDSVDPYSNSMDRKPIIKFE